MMQIFEIIILILSAVAHEYMHGWVAFSLGDPTAKNAGRLTLNPLAHLEWFGSVILPLFMVVTGMPFVFGWAKPVPYNPFNLRDKRWGDAKVAAAGPLTNFFIAIVFGLFLRLVPGLNAVFANFVMAIVYINLILGVFNLIPLPPLDGSKILASFFPYRAREAYMNVGRMGFLLVIIVVLFAGELIIPLVNLLFKLIVG